jgi:hypothetical protein
VASTLAQSKVRAGKRAQKSSSAAREKFWVRKPNAELDRAGDWLLANLTKMRTEAVSRAHPR